uniref:Integrin alpha-M-like n=1 Tax=Pogona vitticeps TaxID=103695 RepID=A0A6J0TQQ7_9SAUR
MGPFEVLIVTLLFLGATESADDIFDLSDALDPGQPPRINQDKESCPNDERDIVFLIDGSSSLTPSEFMQMKIFLAFVMKSFPDNTQFSLLQFSNQFREHFDFRHFSQNQDPDRLLRDVAHLRGSSYTATAIRKAVRELFTTQKGARNTAKRFLVVVTDGEKIGDPLDYAEVTEEANRAMITRFAIGAGLGFIRKTAQQELHAMASHPAPHHVIVVRHFSELRNIQAELKEKICATRGQSLPQPASGSLSPDTCSSHSDPQVLQKLEQVLTGLDQVKTKLDLLAAKQGKCGRDSLFS